MDLVDLIGSHSWLTAYRPVMERRRVNASILRSAAYDAGKRLLEIEFSSGSIVQYSGVPAEVHRRFMSSPSAGSFFQDLIEENFPASRVRQWKLAAKTPRTPRETGTNLKRQERPARSGVQELINPTIIG